MAGKPRLRGLGQRLAPLRPALQPIQTHDGPGRARQRKVLSPWRKMYGTARWRELREFVIKRDGGVCQQTGVLLVGGPYAPNSPVVDHIEPHRGDPDKFYDPDNLQLVSKEWHDGEKQSLERKGTGGWAKVPERNER